MARPVPLNPAFLPPTYGVLKSLLENPLKLPLHHEDGERDGGGRGGVEQGKEECVGGFPCCPHPFAPLYALRVVIAVRNFH